MILDYNIYYMFYPLFSRFSHAFVRSPKHIDTAPKRLYDSYHGTDNQCR